MRTRWTTLAVLGILLFGFFTQARERESQSDPTAKLEGLWGAKLRLGPDIRGNLVIRQTRQGWLADISGFLVPVAFDRENVSFELPDGKGKFRGKRSGQEITGQWIQPITQVNGAMLATPVMLTADGPSFWRGIVTPLEDTFTWYLPVIRRQDGAMAAYLRNPERNQGLFLSVTRIEREGDTIRLLGRRNKDAPESVVVKGRYENDQTISFSLRGGLFEFTKMKDVASNPFYPRGKPGQRYTYTPPVLLKDGWPVGTLEDVGMARAQIEKFIQMLIDVPMDSIGSSQVHSVLIARHGKLVVEEYFHGYNRDMPHDTRSAAKSWTATLIGAAIQSGIPIALATPVYKTMLGSLPNDLDPRKRAMTLEHLVSMTAGFDCDDNDSSAPLNEDAMQEQQQEPDWYRYTLNAPMASTPGEKIVYCSAVANLAGGVLSKIAGEPLPELFHRLIAQPLQMGTYHLFLTPTGDAYGGGGHHFLPRDFMKLAQLMVNGGKWNSKQILSKDWTEKSGAALRDLSPVQQYGYLWNSVQYPYKDKKVHAYFAAGNGGQIFMGIPELDLVIAFTGGSYADAALFIPQRKYVPEYILPAIH
jgi:CubicO group peptidase (beta-lactamase class C family)